MPPGYRAGVTRRILHETRDTELRPQQIVWNPKYATQWAPPLEGDAQAWFIALR